MSCPRKEVDWDRVDELCELQCTVKEVAADQGMHPDTLNKRIREETEHSSFTSYFQEKRQPGLSSLRHKQYVKAVEQENTTMLIWLGKNWLNQSDKVEEKIDQEQPTKIIYEVADEGDTD